MVNAFIPCHPLPNSLLLFYNTFDHMARAFIPFIFYTLTLIRFCCCFRSGKQGRPISDNEKSRVRKSPALFSMCLRLIAGQSRPGRRCFHFFNSFPAGGNRPLRTYKDTKMASDAFFPVQHRLSLRVQCNSLMPSIRAGDHTPAAADAFFPMEFWKQNRIPFQYIC